VEIRSFLKTHKSHLKKLQIKTCVVLDKTQKVDYVDYGK